MFTKSIQDRISPLLSNPLSLHIVLSIIAFLITFSRRPDALLNPQFWAEDGIWYADAYNLGVFEAFTKVEAGYYQTISRLIASLSQIFPLAAAPWIFNLAGFAVKIIIVNFLFTKRFEQVVSNVPARLVLAFIYLAVPHSSEIHINLTNTQWHLPILCFLILISPPANNIFWKIFDTIVFIIFSLSGPFCLLLLPIAGIRWLHKKEKYTLYLLLLLLAGCFIQSYGLLHSTRVSRFAAGGFFGDFFNVLAGHIFFTGLFGEVIYESLLTSRLRDFVFVLLNLFGFVLIIYAIVKGRSEIKLLILFAALVFVTSLFSMDNSGPENIWRVLTRAFFSNRYWFIPIIAYLTLLVYSAFEAKNLVIKFLGRGLLLMLPFGVIMDWSYKPFPDLDFQKYVLEFEAAPSGTVVDISINPHGWKVHLNKK